MNDVESPKLEKKIHKLPDKVSDKGESSSDGEQPTVREIHTKKSKKKIKDKKLKDKKKEEKSPKAKEKLSTPKVNHSS